VVEKKVKVNPLTFLNLYSLLSFITGEDLTNVREIELRDVEVEIDKLEIVIRPVRLVRPQPKPKVEEKPREEAKVEAKPEAVSIEVKPTVEEKRELPKIEVELVPIGLPPAPEIELVELPQPKVSWKGKINTVKVGATREEGGTREVVYILGGQKAPQLYAGPHEFHKPVMTMDVFDMKIPLPRAVKMMVGEDVLDNPPEWAKRCVEKFGADMISLHLISTDPKIKDTPPKEAVKVVEEVLQAVKVPLFIGGSGNPKKDTELFKEISERFAGERLLLSPVTLDMKLDEVIPAIKKGGHAVVASVTMNIDQARQLTRKLLTWLTPNDIAIDLYAAGIGYGWEYAFSAMERARLAAFSGDTELQYPAIGAASNAWGAREAWMKMDPFWGPREIRGPLWEIITALSLVMIGIDLILSLHPLTVKVVKDVCERLSCVAPSKDDVDDYRSWLSKPITVEV